MAAAVALTRGPSGAPLNAANDAGDKALHLAAQYGDLASVRTAIEQGQPIALLGHDDWTPLHYAAEGGSTDVALYLLALGADKKVKVYGNKTPAILARRAGHKETAKAIGSYKPPKEEKSK